MFNYSNERNRVKRGALNYQPSKTIILQFLNSSTWKIWDLGFVRIACIERAAREAPRETEANRCVDQSGDRVPPEVWNKNYPAQRALFKGSSG